MRNQIEADRAIEHCERHIARVRAEIERRESLGQDSTKHRARLKTLELLRGVHQSERLRAHAA